MSRTTVSEEANAVEENAPSLFYALDNQDRIIDVGGAWDDFARANDGVAIMRDRVLGTQVFNYIDGDISAMYLRTLLSSVRILGRSVTRCYRCDSPGTKRYMEMTLTPDTDSSVTIAHRLLRTERLPARFSFTVARGHSSFLVRCSMCNRVKKTGEWQEPEVAWRAGNLTAPEPQAVIYGICLHCMSGLRGADT